MSDELSLPRRRLLATALGSSALAGCSGSSSDSTTSRKSTSETGTTTTRETATADPATTESDSPVANRLTFDVETTVADGTPQVRVSGTGSHSDGIEAVRVSVGSDDPVELTDDELELGGEAPDRTEAEFEARRTVPGGQRYGVEVDVVPLDGDRLSRRTLSDYVTEPHLRDGADSTVVANYYPWYGPDRHGLFVDEPVISDYDSRDADTIERHVEWATEYGVDAFCASWWGQDSWEDETLSEHFVPADATDEIDFCILYESKSLLERTEDGVTDFDDDRVRDQFVDDVAYLAEQYFGEDNYLRVDGKPLVYLYSAMHFEGDLEGTFAEAAEAAGEELFVVLEIVDWRFPRARDREMMQVADGVTPYEMYRSIEDIDENFAERMTSYYPEWLLAARDNDCAFLPMVMPGFNGRQTSEENADMPILTRSRERMRRVCELTEPYLDPTTDLSFVTSWNEWHEHTQVEPSEEHGTSDLEVIRDTLAEGDPDHWLPETVTVTFSFDDTVKESTLIDETPREDRDLAFALQRIHAVDANGERIESYDLGIDGEEPALSGGIYDQAVGEEKSWRWLGGDAAAARITFDESVLDAESLELVGFPATDGLSGTVSVGGLELGSVEFGERRTQSYSFDLV